MDADVLAINDSRALRAQDYWLLKVVEWVVSFCKRRQVGSSGEGDSSLRGGWCRVSGLSAGPFQCWCGYQIQSYIGPAGVRETTGVSIHSPVALQTEVGLEKNGSVTPTAGKIMIQVGAVV